MGIVEGATGISLATEVRVSNELPPEPETTLGIQIRKAIRAVPVDPELRTRVLRMIRQGGEPNRLHSRLKWMAAAAAAGLAIVVWNRTLGNRPLDLAQIAAEHHVACVNDRRLPIEALSTALEGTASRLRFRLGPEDQFVGAHTCTYGSFRTSHFVIKSSGTIVSLTISPHEDWTPERAAWQVPTERNHFRVSMVKAREHVICLVSNLPLSAHRALATSLEVVTLLSWQTKPGPRHWPPGSSRIRGDGET